ncbi:hypothetical protein DH2020_035543 [Rehmannia glutinosa]|uniref:STAS domain-containing protein n=1 Tax=Rehmannia glutinosa TaxID=99300 RepID=A0ABR0V632_REHGL
MAMAKLPADNNSTFMELQKLSAADNGAAGRSERAKWLLNSPDHQPSPWKELFSSLKETVLPQAKTKQPRPNRPLMFLQALFPILKWGKNYKATKFKHDLLAGLTLASLCIPQSIGYANLAKMDPQYGLYTSVVPPLIYAVMGSSREIAIGPVAVVSLLLSAMISKVVDPSADPTAYRAYCFYGHLLRRTFQAMLGFLVDFLSHAAIVGFMGGAAIVIGLQQLKGLLGINHFTSKTDVVSVLGAVVKALHHQHFKGGLNPSSVHQLDFGGPNVGAAAKIGLICALIALTEAIAVGRSFASMKGYHLDGNKEMVAMGFMNIIGSLTSCYTATGSFSRTAVNFSAGSFVLHSAAILASIILSALPGLIDLNEAYNIWKVDKLDFMVCLGAFFGVLFGSVEIGLLVAVVMSFGKIIVSSIKPSTEIVGRLPGTDLFCNILQYPAANKIPGILITRINSGTFCFANASFIRERIMRSVREESDREESNKGRLHVLVLDMTNVMNIDTSGIHALEELHQN